MRCKSIYVKYEIGDKVYYMYNNEIQDDVIYSIIITSDSISYTVKENSMTLNEEELGENVDDVMVAVKNKHTKKTC